MDRFCPPAVVVDQNLEIFAVPRRRNSLFQPASGKASLNLFNMLLPGLEFELRSLIDRAKSGHRDVRRENLQIEIGGVLQMLSLEVIPVGRAETQAGTFIVAFAATHSRSTAATSGRCL